MTVQETSVDKPEEFVEYKVSRKSPDGFEKAAGKLAGAISSLLRNDKGVVLRCIGAASVYKAVCAVAKAKGYVYANGIKLEASPVWSVLENEDGPSASMIKIFAWGEKTVPGP
jgi:stage V sporulation protein SpoVS